MSAEIAKVLGRQVWDSRGRPTIEAEVTLASGAVGRAIAPSGASTGRREALDLRDGGSRLGGFGVSKALLGINTEIAAELRGLDALDQRTIDASLIALDGTTQKTRLGGNALVAVSSAIAWAAANEKRVPLWLHLRDLAGLAPDEERIPSPMIQIFGGGRHADNRVDVQDFLVLCLSAKSFGEALDMTAEVYFAAADVMRSRGCVSGIADEGGIWPDFRTNEEGLETLVEAIENAGFSAGRDVGIALDIAASSFGADGVYRLALEGRELTSTEMVEMIMHWCARYPIVSIEDPVGEDDDLGFVEITKRLGDRVQITGDDFLATDVERVKAAGRIDACNAALLKADQCGTITELISASEAARALGWNTILSGRSGESEDISLSHFAVGLLGDQIKVGSIARSERTAKWNELLRIEEALPAGAFSRFRLPGRERARGARLHL